jgi:hypothetical protein
VNSRGTEPDLLGVCWPSITLVYHGGPLDGHREAWPQGLRPPDARSFERFAYRPTPESWRYVMQSLIDGEGIDLLNQELHYVLSSEPRNVSITERA